MGPFVHHISSGLLFQLAQIGGREFPAPVDLDIEGQAVILRHRAKARTLQIGNVHEHILATIITLDKAKTLHVVEEFDGAVGAFARKFALGRSTIAAAEAATITAAISATEATAIATPKTSTIAAIKAATFGARCAFWHRKRIAFDHQIGRRNLAATINEREFERLAFCQTRQACLLNRADMDENVIGLLITLDEAEAFLSIKEFDDSLSGTDDLRGHCRTTRGTATAAETAATAAAKTAAAFAAETAGPSAATIISAAYFARKAGGFTKIIVAETITLVTATATTLVIETHVLTVTFISPIFVVPCSIGR
jgi:hypothetical protein